MKVRVNRKSVYEAAAKAYKIQRRATLNRVETCLYMEVLEDTLSFSAFSSEMSIRISSEFEHADATFSCLFQTDSFLNVVGKMRSDEITMELIEEKNWVLLLKGDSVRVTIQCEDVALWPGFPEIKEPEFVTETDFLFPAIAQCAHALSTTADNSVASSFCIQQEAEKWKITALDGYRISSRGELLGTQEHEILLNGSSMSTLHDIFGNESITLSIKEKSIQISNKTIIAVLRAIDGIYYNLTTVLQAPTKINAKVNKEELQNILELAVGLKHFSGQNNKQKLIIEINGPEKNARLTMSDELNNCMESMLEMKMDYQKTMKIGINPRYLLEAVKSISEEELSIRFGDEKSPVILSGNGYIELVLPLTIR